MNIPDEEAVLLSQYIQALEQVAEAAAGLLAGKLPPDFLAIDRQFEAFLLGGHVQKADRAGAALRRPPARDRGPQRYAANGQRQMDDIAHLARYNPDSPAFVPPAH